MSDLVIGGRRSTPGRPLRAAAISLLILMIGLLVAYVIYRRVVTYVVPDGSVADTTLVVTTPDGDGVRLELGGATLEHRGSITVLRLVGKPHTIGATHGRLLGQQVADTATSLQPSVDGTVLKHGFLSSMTHGLRLRWRHRLLDDGIPGHQLVEVIGMVRGASHNATGPSYEDFLRQQSIVDVGAPVPSSGRDRIARSLTFITSLRSTSGDRMLVGRMITLDGLTDGGERTSRPVVSFVHADGVLPFASVGWPGLVGVVSGINSEGIAVMVHPVRTGNVRVTRQAQPVALIARDVLENAHSLDEAVSILENAQPLGAAAFVIIDGTSRKLAVVERDPDTVSVRRDPSPPVVGDILYGKAFTDDPDNDRAKRSTTSESRVKRVAELLRAAKPKQPADVAAILRDRRAAGGSSLPAGHQAAIDDPNSAVMIFDPSGMVLWVSEGPGASGRMLAFDLRHELRKEGNRPAAPAAIERGDDSAARAVVESRRDVRAARRALLADRQSEAMEHAVRALARRSDLPEALLVAGQIARASGDDAAMRSFFKRYLDYGAEDAVAAEQLNVLMQAP